VADTTNIGRQLAHAVLEALKKAGHILLAAGSAERAARELAEQMEPTLPRVLSKVVRSPIMGEVSSTFGDEATDEIVEAMVEDLRETVLDSEAVEDVFAEDRVIERVIFTTLRDELRAMGNAEEEEPELPPISVKLDTLGYVAKAAARGAPAETLKDALSRAAEAVSAELDRFDAEENTAFFRPGDADPDKRIDIETAIEEELSDLVDLGVVELPSERRTLPLPPLAPEARKGLSRRLDDLAARHLANPLCPGSWDWGPDKASVVLSFTPVTTPNPALLEASVAAFREALASVVDGDDRGPPSARDVAPPTRRSGEDVSEKAALRLLAALESNLPPSRRAPASSKPAAKPAAASKAKTPAAKKPAAKKPAAKKPAASDAPKKPAAASKATKKPAVKKPAGDA
jgi:hypothetical protein